MSNINKTTLKMIAGRTNMSVSTISRVLSGQASAYRISKRTEEEVFKIAKDLQYAPNQLARSLRLRQTNTIGVIIPDISNTFFSSIARYVEIECRKDGYSVMICDSQEDTAIEKDSIKTLEMRRVDGIIICPVGLESDHVFKLSERGIPVVTVDRYFPHINLSYVVSDNYNGAIKAVNHFVENGHRKIAFIQGIPGSSVNKDRVRGYRDAHEKWGIPLNESFIVGDSFGEHSGYIGTKILLTGPERPTAIFAGSNLISLGSMRAIMEENLKIPDDISMIAFDDQPYSDFLPTPMTAVRQKKEEIGKLSIKLLLDEIDLDKISDKKRIIVPTELIIRKSVRNMI